MNSLTRKHPYGGMLLFRLFMALFNRKLQKVTVARNFVFSYHCARPKRFPFYAYTFSRTSFRASMSTNTLTSKHLHEARLMFCLFMVRTENCKRLRWSTISFFASLLPPTACYRTLSYSIILYSSSQTLCHMLSVVTIQIQQSGM